MKQNRMSILVLDHQAYWREFATETLRFADYTVSARALYDEALPPQQEGEKEEAILVLLGCPAIEQEERMLIARLLARGHYVIVFATLLPIQVMRTLFIKGVEDAVDKTYDSTELVEIVEQALERIAERKHAQFPIERIYYE
jgi:FixJ family two-component response regulator